MKAQQEAKTSVMPAKSLPVQLSPYPGLPQQRALPICRFNATMEDAPPNRLLTTGDASHGVHSAAGALVCQAFFAYSSRKNSSPQDAVGSQFSGGTSKG